MELPNVTTLGPDHPSLCSELKSFAGKDESSAL